MATYPDKITLQCPGCKKNLRPAEFMRHATLVVYRTCRDCDTLWCVKIKPMSSDESKTVHLVDWQPLKIPNEKGQ